ncbi:MAG: DMT family transporter [Clostridia bacterium]|nr:DMT family transporter [Clostridia bacterium]
MQRFAVVCRLPLRRADDSEPQVLILQTFSQKTATLLALLAAALYAVNIPLSKLLLNHVQPMMMASLLYLGAGLGLWLTGLIRADREKPAPVTAKEAPYVAGMILLDIAAPILLMLGLRTADAANASLLNNFEIVATSLIALVIFRERISGWLGLAILLVTAASIALSWEGSGSLRFNGGSLLVLAAASCWGLENNCTRMLSHRSAAQTTVLKGFGSGTGSLIVALLGGEGLPAAGWIPCVLLLGFVAYGLSITCYIRAQYHLGAARTSAYYSIAPFLGVLLSMLLLGETPAPLFWAGLGIMIIATLLMLKDTFAAGPEGETDP